MITKAPRSWLSSPLGVNILLALSGVNGPIIDKYAQVYSTVKGSNAITIKNKILVPSKEKIENGQISSENDIQKTHLKNIIISWQKQQEGFAQNIEKYVTLETASLHLNISTVKGKWKYPIDGKTPLMKVYNSFNYTQDVKYEARLLELPLQEDDLKLVIAVPNEKDTLSTLVATLTEEGLEAAVKSIQPLFTTSTALVAPEINFDSEMTTTIDRFKTAIQYGGIDVNENGLSVKVLTCLLTHKEVNSLEFKKERTPLSFFLAVTFKGIPIFTGNFTPPLL